MCFLANHWICWTGMLLAALCLWRLRRLRLERDSLLNEKDVIYDFVHDVSEVFSESADAQIDTLLRRVLFYARQTAKAQAGAVYFLEPEDNMLAVRAISGLFPPLAAQGDALAMPAALDAGRLETIVRERRVAVGEGLIGKVAAHNLPLLIADAERDARVPHFDNPMLQIRTMLLVPMRFKRSVLGVLALVNRIDDTQFIQSDLTLLQALADQASITVYFARFNAELDKKRVQDADLQVSRKIQNNLLPARIPDIAGMDCAAFSLPAREVGGDYYDFVRVDDHHYGVVIADVAGKGVAGAIFMSICRSVFRANAPGCLHPAQVLQVVNKVISEDIQEDMFISMLYLVMDTRDYTVAMARAGHPRPLVVRAGAPRAEILDGPGIAVGLADIATFNECLTETSFRMGPGDTLLAYTDGVVEAINGRREEWGQSHLERAAVKGAAGAAADMVAAVRAGLLDFVRDVPQYDDMTLLVLHRKE